MTCKSERRNTAGESWVLEWKLHRTLSSTFHSSSWLCPCSSKAVFDSDAERLKWNDVTDWCVVFSVISFLRSQNKHCNVINPLQCVNPTTGWCVRKTRLRVTAYATVQCWNIDSCKSVVWTKSPKPTSLRENQSADRLEPVPLSPLSALSLNWLPRLITRACLIGAGLSRWCSEERASSIADQLVY